MHLKLFVTLCLLLVATALKAEVRAFINQGSVYEGDPVTLTIESFTNNKASPDLSPLKKDFQILGTSTSTQVKIRNGQQQFRKSWTIELQPGGRKSIEIPPIRIGQESTQPIKLEIQAVPANVRQGTSEHVFIESSVDIPSGTTYVQQQIPYTVRLYYDETMQTGQIHSPAVENAVVEQLGQDRRYQTVRMGRKYSVLEKHYVISPEKSGKLTIPPSSARGRLLVEDPNKKRQDSDDFVNRFFGRSPFDNDPFFRDLGGSIFSARSRAPSKPFTASTDTIEVEVLPVPTSFSGKAWLPAEDLIIQDSWSQNRPTLKVGEPVSRTLTIQAKGLAGSQIPQIEIARPDNIRLYPEQAKPDTRTDGKTVYGKLEMSLSYLPDKAGKVTIPAVSLDWWNVTSKQQQTFTLDKMILDVAPGAGGIQASQQQTTASTQQNAPAENSQDKRSGGAGNDVNTLNSESEDSAFLSYWQIALVTSLAVLLLFYLYRRRSSANIKPGALSHVSVLQKGTRPETRKINASASSAELNQIKSQLQQACASNNAADAEKALLALAAASWNKDADAPKSLASLARQVNQGQNEILELERARYADAKQSSAWKGDALWQAIKAGIRPQSGDQPVSCDALEPLYPQS